MINNLIIFNNNIDQLFQRLKNLTGITPKRTDHPLVEHLISARKNYLAENKKIGCAKATYSKLALEDIETIQKCDIKLYRYFKKMLNIKPLPIDNYFGLRLELRMAASLLNSKIAFEKTEVPDFILSSFKDVGIECTSSHLDLGASKVSKGILYKINLAISHKNGYIYKTKFNILAVDVSNLLFHEGQEECIKILSDKDKALSELKEKINNSIFHSLIYFYYAWFPLGDRSNGVNMRYIFCRIDSDKIDPACKKFLDIKYPFGDEWREARLFKTV